MRVVVLVLTLVSLFLYGVPVQAASALPPGQKPGKYYRWSYPSQMSYGPIEDGSSNIGSAPAPGAFLTLPFMGPHYVTSIFDHCGPNYATHGKVCRYDGQVASATVGGPDPTFDAGYAQTPGHTDYLYYDGHDGYDYGLYYEPVAAAADGRVMLANWAVPSCHSCLSGMTIEVNHGNGLLTYYGHLSQINVTKGQWVSRGQVIGVSGMTGTATGPHLHFGVYYVNGNGPVDPYGWSGSGADPYPKDLGDLWISGSPRFAGIPMPQVSVNAVPEVDNPSALDVSWSSPGGGNMYTVSAVYPNGSIKLLNGPTRNNSVVFNGGHGQSYWFWVSVRTDLGWSDANGSPVITIPHLNHGAVS
jgi:murein DD-endopeptidase MepM/ murein hydrolase activator NlpD